MEQLRMINKMGTIPAFTIADGYTIRMYQEGDIPANGFAAGQTADGLIDHRLENRGGEILSGRPFIN